MGDFWVFGYGSLMWRPGFAHLETAPALLHGVHRSLCIFSHVHRGTPQRPGLVLGLDRGGSCRGVAFRVGAADRDTVLAYLRTREQATKVYLERWRKLRLGDARGPETMALCYVVDRTHTQYAGELSLDEQVRLVCGGRGQSGANPDYVLNTSRHLRDMGIRDHRLEALAARLQMAAADG